MTVHPKSALLVLATHGAVIVASIVKPCITLTNTFSEIGLEGTLCLPLLLVPSDGTVVYLPAKNAVCFIHLVCKDFLFVAFYH
jgi:hypothetical protein